MALLVRMNAYNEWLKPIEVVSVKKGRGYYTCETVEGYVMKTKIDRSKIFANQNEYRQEMDRQSQAKAILSRFNDGKFQKDLLNMPTSQLNDICKLFSYMGIKL